jgi:hypothetical protein
LNPDKEAMKYILYSFLVLLMSFNIEFAHAAQKTKTVSSPDIVVRELYRLHNDGKGHIFEAKGKQYIYKFFDQNLADLIWKDVTQTPEGEVGKLDFDPLYNAQDTGITKFHIAKPVIEGDDSSVVVSFRNFGQPVTIKFEMHKDQQRWKIRNLIYGDKSDLVKILT